MGRLSQRGWLALLECKQLGDKLLSIGNVGEVVGAARLYCIVLGPYEEPGDVGELSELARVGGDDDDASPLGQAYIDHVEVTFEDGLAGLRQPALQVLAQLLLLNRYEYLELVLSRQLLFELVVVSSESFEGIVVNFCRLLPQSTAKG